MSRVLLALRLQGWDLVALVILTAIAFFIRFFSPITPNFIAHPFSGQPISFCVPNTPVDVYGDPGTLCGLAYPPLRWLYDYAWFVGFLVSGAAYVALMGGKK